MKLRLSFILAFLVVAFSATSQTITGVLSVCEGGSVGLTGTPSGGTWASGTPAVATVSATGMVSGLTVGTAVVTYTFGGSPVTAVVTVNAVPASVTGGTALCVGSSMPLYDVTGGGTWSSSSPATATVSPSGVVTGIAAGSAVITYSLGTGCYAVKSVTVNPNPSSITGAGNICTGVTSTMYCYPSGGTWSTTTSSLLSIAASSGTVSPVLPGLGTIIYTIPATGCYSSRVVTVNASPGPILGMSTVCPGSSITLTNTSESGVWISGNTSVATVSGATGTGTTLTGVAGGTATISYVVGGICMVTSVATVNPAPSAGTLAGPATVCAGATATLTSTVSGGTWSSATPSIGTVDPTTGVFAGLAVGNAIVSYTSTNMCGTATSTLNVTVSPMPASISGTLSFCRGASSTLSNTVPGGTWSSGTTSVASVGSTSGSVLGVTAGTASIFYYTGSGCFVTATVTVNPAPAPISSTASSVCVGSVITLSDTAAGGTWASSSLPVATIATIGSSTGVVTGVSAGTVTMTYAIGSCIATKTITVNPLPTISASFIPDGCGGGYTMNATGSGIVSYTWAPSVGLSCTACATTWVNPTSTSTYTVTGVNGFGCANTAAVTLNGDRIKGYVSFAGAPPAVPDIKVFLIRVDPTDSTVLAADSVSTCFDGFGHYFGFTGKAAGKYYVLAELQGTIPGISGYVPTYAGASAHWAKATINDHISGGGNVADINMVYASLPSGPGTISGYVYSGAGKGTVGEVEDAGVLVFLKDALTGQILTHAYTNAEGKYSFGSVAEGSYLVYPEYYQCYTTPSSVVSVTATNLSVADVTFKRHTGSRTIRPFVLNAVSDVNNAGTISAYPVPAKSFVNIVSTCGFGNDATITLTDVTGRDVYSQKIPGGSNDPLRIDVSGFAAGMYLVKVQSSEGTSSMKITVE